MPSVFLDASNNRSSFVTKHYVFPWLCANETEMRFSSCTSGVETGLTLYKYQNSPHGVNTMHLYLEVFLRPTTAPLILDTAAARRWHASLLGSCLGFRFPGPPYVVADDKASSLRVLSLPPPFSDIPHLEHSARQWCLARMIPAQHGRASMSKVSRKRRTASNTPERAW